MSASTARRAASVVATAIAVLLLAWAVVIATRSAPSSGEPQARGGGSEVEEELSEQTEERLEGIEEAAEQGIKWQVRTSHSGPRPADDQGAQLGRAHPSRPHRLSRGRAHQTGRLRARRSCGCRA